MLAFDTGPGVAVIDGVARLVDRGAPTIATADSRRRERSNEAVLRRAAGRSVLRRAAAQEHRPGAVRRPVRPRAASARARPRRRRHRRRAHRAQRRRRGGPLDPAGRRGRRLGRRLPSPRAHGRARAGTSRRCRRAHPLRRFDELFFPGDAKEAVAFALLGYLTLHGQPGNVPAATGAARPPRARHGHARMSEAAGASHRPPDPAGAARPARERLRPRGRPHRRRARARRRRVHHLRRHRGDRSAGSPPISCAGPAGRC